MRLRLRTSGEQRRRVFDDGADVLRALTPEDLAERAAGGSVASFGELTRRFEVRLFNFLLRKLSSRVDAEDLTQETLVRAWEKIGSYNRRWRFSTWLFTIGSRMAVSHYRKQRPTGPALEVERAGAAPVIAERDEAEVRVGRRLWALAASLSPEQHEAIWLRYAEDMEIPEIAKVMRKSHVGVRVCLFRARQALALKLGQEQDARNEETKAPELDVPLVHVVGRAAAGGVR